MMKLKNFGLPILAVVVLFLAIGMIVQHFLPVSAAAPAWDSLSVVEGKNHPPRTRGLQPLGALPAAPENNNPFAWDFSAWNLSKLDLSNSGKQLSDWATFDSTTIWPASLPAEFSPAKAMELGKDPGLGLKALHGQGITGKGVHVAILDQTLFNDHQEYAGRIVKYTEVGQVASQPEIHGAAVASILAGKNVGVAPEAQVTYYAIQIVKDWNAEPVQRTFTYMAAAINKILDDNKSLPAGQRIRVISASIGAGKDEEGYDAVNAAYQRAIREGVLVVTTDMVDRYDYAVHGLGRNPTSDPNDVASYEPGSWWADQYFPSGQINPKLVFAPMDSRTTAAESGVNQYRFYRIGGLSWSVPWMAGVYALACQVNPKVTPERFLKAAHDTGDYVSITHEGKTYKLGPIMNPAKIIAALK